MMDAMPDRSTLLARLQADFGYPPTGAVFVADKLEQLTPRVASSFWAWWHGAAMSETLTIEGYDVQRLEIEHGMNRIAAFLTLDWLEREPVRAKASLARGHDRIVPRNE